MKKILFIASIFITANVFAQKWETIKGNGKSKTETRQVDNFTSLASQGSMDVFITYGSNNSITVEADENLIPYIETKVDDGKLIIRTKKNVNLKSTSKTVVKLSMTTVNSIQQSGSGNVYGSGAFSSDRKTDVAVSGSGNLKLDFSSFKDLDLSVSGSGNVDLKSGSTNSLSAKISGSGNIDCSTVSSKDVDAKISGSGNIKVYASNSLDAKISGSGNVLYKGDVQNISSKIVGSGKVMRM